FSEPLERPWFLYDAGWQPASRYWKPSEAVHLAALLVEARRFASNPQEVISTATRLVLTSYEYGWNGLAGALLLDCGPSPEPTARQQRNLQWWAQFELLRAAEYLTVLLPGNGSMRTVRD